MKYKILDDKDKETYEIGYKVGNRQLVITDIEWENENENKIYRKGYMAGLMDYKRNVSNVSKVINVSNVDIATPITSTTPKTPISISISKGISNKYKYNEKKGGVGENNSVTDSPQETIQIPEWLLDSTGYDLLTSLQREFVDNPEMRVLLNQFWGGKSSVRNDIANLYLQLLENRMKRQETKKMVGNLTDKLNVNSVENENSIEEISKTEEFSFAKTRNWQDVPTLYPRVYKKIENWINSDKFTGRGTKRNKTWIINLCETFNKKDEK